ncbi:MAG: DNA polymerase III subunit gamma and tau [Actinobacteria bacterium]|uniref:DNA-directed DNA polymerase n=1 Tax=freshwater metagenome TaxID=449393 RepID=A0A6J5ZPG1_9ZZZZ|nr:DNA polymerase III subunit gamma and tau [Actinomycetota bacterium]
MSLALYRKYRPGRFAEVIGQDHVTVPLSRALNTGRIHHAYLFTGPRGCGKTSSARIMARSINCQAGPTSDPCGTCQSCIDLAPNGPGSIDVIEIDAATYRGIEDAKELRERALYAPVASRFKVYIIDEAHQLTKDAFNVLLKMVEEPPPHLLFIFATTEPDKIISTLRSRTHHYPFRLVSARVLQERLAQMCVSEGVEADPAALALIARAGAGSVRDSQSVLGQVIAGSGPEGITYAETVKQLGFTDEVLLGRVIDAIAQGDGPSLFSLVNDVVNSGHEPRRFVMDLLERLRDLVVVIQVPQSARSGMFDLPDEQIDDLEKQAQLFTASQVVRIADLVSAGLSELRGAYSPRLQLELLVARLITPAASLDVEERLLRLEQSSASVALPPATRSRLADAMAAAPARKPAEKPESSTDGARNSDVETLGTPSTSVETSSTDSESSLSDAGTNKVPVEKKPAVTARKSATPPPMKPSQVIANATKASASDTPVGTVEAPASAEGGAKKSKPQSAKADPIVDQSLATGEKIALTIENVKANWPKILVATAAMGKVAGIVTQNTVALSVSGTVVAVAFPNQGILTNAQTSGHIDRLAAAISQVMGTQVRVDAMVDAGATQVAATKKNEGVERGEASPDDETLSQKSALQMVTEAFGAKVINESPRE